MASSTLDVVQVWVSAATAVATIVAAVAAVRGYAHECRHEADYTIE